MNHTTKQSGLLILALLLVTGCRSTGLDWAALPPTPARQAVRHSIVVPALILFPPFQYPADMTNYVWCVQFSDDLQHWTNQIIGMKSPDGSLGPPLDVPMPGMCGFWRMMGMTNRNL